MNQEELKQRLVVLLEQCSCPYSPPCTSECYECNKVEMYDKEIANIADHLIANGVTIRERGEWKEETEYYDDEYSECNVRRVFVCSICGRTELRKQPYCNCGADMRGGKDE